MSGRRVWRSRLVGRHLDDITSCVFANQDAPNASSEPPGPALSPTGGTEGCSNMSASLCSRFTVQHKSVEPPDSLARCRRGMKILPHTPLGLAVSQGYLAHARTHALPTLQSHSCNS